jgi:hypothetical protein
VGLLSHEDLQISTLNPYLTLDGSSNSACCKKSLDPVRANDVVIRQQRSSPWKNGQPAASLRSFRLTGVLEKPVNRTLAVSPDFDYSNKVEKNRIELPEGFAEPRSHGVSIAGCTETEIRR